MKENGKAQLTGKLTEAKMTSQQVSTKVSKKESVAGMNGNKDPKLSKSERNKQTRERAKAKKAAAKATAELAAKKTTKTAAKDSAKDIVTGLAEAASGLSGFEHLTLANNQADEAGMAGTQSAKSGEKPAMTPAAEEKSLEKILPKTLPKSETQEKRSTIILPNTHEDDNFEIKDTLKTGFGVFAMRRFDRNSRIFAERQVLDHTPDTNILYLVALYNITNEAEKDAYKMLHSECQCGAVPCVETEFLKTWHSNCFMINKDDGLGHVYLCAARLNHSCVPNASIGFTKEKNVVIRALRDIESGEEVTIGYDKKVFGETAERREMLRASYNFHCLCEGCETNAITPPRNTVIDDDDLERCPYNALIGREKSVYDDIDHPFKQWSYKLGTQVIAIWRRLLGRVMQCLRAEDYDKAKDNAAYYNAPLLNDFCKDWTEYIKQNNDFGFSTQLLHFCCYQMMLEYHHTVKDEEIIPQAAALFQMLVIMQRYIGQCQTLDTATQTAVEVLHGN